jgi:Family of unknown function (DUF5317)
MERPMLLATALLACVVSVLLTGGRLGALADLRIRRPEPLLAAFGLQLLSVYVISDAPSELLNALHLASYAGTAVTAAANLRVPGLAVVVLGGLCNFAAIAANGGVMPARQGALETAGLATESTRWVSSLVVDDARLAFLGDVFAVPSSWPMANVFSVGDILIVAGAFVLLHVVAGSRVGRLLPVRPRALAA